MGSQNKPADSTDDLWGDILEALKACLPSMLEKHLRFAPPCDVAALVFIQVRWSGVERHTLDLWFAERPSGSQEYRKWLRKKAAELVTPLPPYVDHCELVAEYRNPKTTKQRRAVVRELFRAETSARVSSFVDAVLEKRGRAGAGDVTIERICLRAQDKLFGESEFGKVALSYQCAKGMTFERYLLRKGLFLVHDEVEAFLQSEPETSPIDDRAKTGTVGHGRGWQQEADQEETGKVQHDLQTSHDVEVECFPLPKLTGTGRSAVLNVANDATARLRDVVARVRTILDSERHVALVFLYFKAYVEPEVIPRRVVQQVGGGKSRLQRDYDATQCALQQLREEFIEAAANVDAVDSQLRRKAGELRSRFGVGATDLVGLELTARRSAIGDMEKVLSSVNPAADAQRACALEYMLAYKRVAAAQTAYEDACACLRRYNDYMKPWVRSQKELAELLDAPQGTIGRELAEMRAALRSLASSNPGLSYTEGEEYAE